MTKWIVQSAEVQQSAMTSGHQPKQALHHRRRPPTVPNQRASPTLAHTSI